MPSSQASWPKSGSRSPRSIHRRRAASSTRRNIALRTSTRKAKSLSVIRSEEHTSELQSLTNLVCRLLLEKKYSCAVPGDSKTDIACDGRALIDEDGDWLAGVRRFSVFFF